MEKIMFGAGCFWGVEAAFQKLKGVNSTKVGYSGGEKPNPTYEEVCTDETGHAEVVFLEYDPKVISLSELLETFWKIHDPTSLNKQGPDIGTQYRSAIFYYSEDQLKTIMESKNNLPNKKDIVTEVAPAKEFWIAEDYHQCYLEKRGLGSCHT